MAWRASCGKTALQEPEKPVKGAEAEFFPVRVAMHKHFLK
jgi:hypothetical protein